MIFRYSDRERITGDVFFKNVCDIMEKTYNIIKKVMSHRIRMPLKLMREK